MRWGITTVVSFAMILAPKSLRLDDFQQRHHGGPLQYEPPRKAEPGSIEEAQQRVAGPVGLRLQRRNILPAQSPREPLHQGLADALLSAIDRDPHRVERG